MQHTLAGMGGDEKSHLLRANRVDVAVFSNPWWRQVSTNCSGVLPLTK